MCWHVLGVQFYRDPAVRPKGTLVFSGMKKKKATQRRKPPSRDSRIPALGKIAKGNYIDFEGFANKHQKFPPPVLIGTFDASDGVDFPSGFRQFVFTEKFRYAGEDARADHLVEYLPDRDGFLEKLVEKSGFGNPVFAYSEYEFNQLTHQLAKQFEKEGTEELASGSAEKLELIKQRAEARASKQLGRRYRNVKLIAARWCRNNIPDDLPGEWSLHELAQAMGLSVTKKLPRGGVTSRLRLVKEYSGSKRRWEGAPSKARKAWLEVLQHNLADVKLIFEMMNRIRPK